MRGGSSLDGTPRNLRVESQWYRRPTLVDCGEKRRRRRHAPDADDRGALRARLACAADTFEKARADHHGEQQNEWKEREIECCALCSVGLSVMHTRRSLSQARRVYYDT